MSGDVLRTPAAGCTSGITALATLRGTKDDATVGCAGARVPYKSAVRAAIYNNRSLVFFLPHFLLTFVIGRNNITLLTNQQSTSQTHQNTQGKNIKHNMTNLV